MRREIAPGCFPSNCDINFNSPWFPFLRVRPRARVLLLLWLYIGAPCGARAAARRGILRSRRYIPYTYTLEYVCVCEWARGQFSWELEREVHGCSKRFLAGQNVYTYIRIVGPLFSQRFDARWQEFREKLWSTRVLRLLLLPFFTMTLMTLIFVERAPLAWFMNNTAAFTGFNCCVWLRERAGFVLCARLRKLSFEFGKRGKAAAFNIDYARGVCILL